MLLIEIKQPQAYKPTDHERAVLAIVAVSDTPQMAAMQVSKNEKLSFSKDNLVDLGFIADFEGGLQLTDTGTALIQAQALTDDMGGPSEEARQLASNYALS